MMAVENSRKISVVTGGAGSVGSAVVRRLNRANWRVVICDNDLKAAEALGCEVGAEVMMLDVTDPDNVTAVAKQIEAEIGPVDALVHCAGIFQQLQPVEDVPVVEWDRVIDLIQRGTYLVDVAFGGPMAQRGSGAIVNMSSWNGQRSAQMHAYCSAKAAVNMLTEGLAVEWGRSGVRVNTISPGIVMTPLVRHRIENRLRYTSSPPEMTALGRLVTPEEVAEAAAFLVSEAASGVTGINLPVDSGAMIVQAWDIFGGIPSARSQPVDDKGISR